MQRHQKQSANVSFQGQCSRTELNEMTKWVPDWKNLVPHGFTGRCGGSHCLRSHTLSTEQNGEQKIVDLINIYSKRPYLPLFKDTMCQWGNVYLLNWDLHYKYPDASWDKEIGSEMFRVIQDCFDKHDSLERMPIFIWYEMTAQHFSGSVGGYYEDIYRENKTLNREHREEIVREGRDHDLPANNDTLAALFNQRRGGCGPQKYLVDQERERHVRRQRVIDTVEQNPNLTFNLEIVYPDRPIQGRREDTLYILPYKDVTDPLWMFHRGGDCTHYCNTPYLYEFLWDSMSRIIEKNQESE